MNPLWFTAFRTILRREIVGSHESGPDLVPPAITMTLYFVIFGSLIGAELARWEAWTT